MVPCTTSAFPCLVAVVARSISGVIGSIPTVEMFFFCLMFYDGLCSRAKKGIKKKFNDGDLMGV